MVYRNLKIHLVLPVYNEEEVIEQVVRENFAFISQLPEGKLIVTEDGSTDGTKEILRQLQKELKFELHSSPHRKGAAQGQRDALAIASHDADIVLISDSDGQHDPQDFTKLLEKMDRFDMVIGRKFPRQDPKIRVYGSRLWNFYLYLLFGLKMRDINCGFRAIKKPVVQAILTYNHTFPECVLTEFSLRTHQLGFSQTEADVRHFWRKSKPKAWNPKKIPSIALNLFFASLRLKRQFKFKRTKRHQGLMTEKYEDLYSDFKKCRHYWEGDMWDYYKLPKYVQVIKSCLTQPLQNTKQASVLELGSGDGELGLKVFKLFEKKFSRFMFSDIIDSAYNTLKKMVKEKRISEKIDVAKIDAQNTKLEDYSFDIVYTVDTMHHVLDPYQMAWEMLRISKRYIFLIESNGLSIPRKILEQTKKYKISNEASFTPWQYKDFFLSFGGSRIKQMTIKPFLFAVPKTPKGFSFLVRGVSEIIERIPFLRWQCSSVVIFIEKNVSSNTQSPTRP